jgi:hypothetical protein
MDNAEKSIEQVNADQIYTSKQFKRIKDNFQVKTFINLYSDWQQGIRKFVLFFCPHPSHIFVIPEMPTGISFDNEMLLIVS